MDQVMKKVSLYTHPEEPAYIKYVTPEEVNQVLEEAKALSPECAQFVGVECVWKAQFPSAWIERLHLKMHYEIN